MAFPAQTFSKRSGTASFPFDDRSPDSFSRDEIMQALKAAPKFQELPCSSVAQISPSLVVKYGQEVHLWEARNMRFAATIPGVRPPQVYDAWEVGPHLPRVYRDISPKTVHDDSITMTYILMDFVPGSILVDVWTSLTVEQRQHVQHQVSSMLHALHQKTMPADDAGPVGGGKSRGLYFTHYDAGPFTPGK